MTPNRPEHADRETPIFGAPRFAIRRVLSGYAYPVHGNVHNPTPQYRWMLLLDGKPVDQDSHKATLVEAARQSDAVTLYAA